MLYYNCTNKRAYKKKGGEYVSQIALVNILKRGDIMKNERIYIRVSEKEKTELQKEAENEQMTLSEYLLNIIRLRRTKK